MPRVTFRRLTLVAVSIAVVLALGRCAGGPPSGASTAPRFLARSGEASFAEMMAEPPSFIYGSSIHVWVYEDDDAAGPSEIAVTGHADRTTCGHATGLFLNALLQKAHDAADLFVAGAGRLVRHEDDARRAQLAELPEVKEYEAAQEEQAISRFMLELTRDRSVQSGADESTVERYTKREAAAAVRVTELENDPEVVEYRDQVSSSQALSTMVREATRLSSTSGLIEVHHVPASLATAVRERLAKAASGGSRTVLSFQDLLESADLDEAVVLADVLHTGTGAPLQLEISAEWLSSTAFQDVARNNRHGVEYAMVGDAESRRAFYRHHTSRYRDEQDECSRMSARELAEEITLDQVCNVDGDCRPADEAEKMTRNEYCTTVIPRNLRILDGWTTSIEELLSELGEDGSGNGSIDRFNHATMLDSLLRDWSLPLSRHHQAWESWRAQQRGPAWQSLRRALGAAGVDVDTISGENVVFAIEVDGVEITVRPVHVIDLARSVVVVDPRAGATRVVDAWSQRSLVREPEVEAGASAAAARAAVDRAIELSGAGNHDAAKTALHQAFAADVAEATRHLAQRHFDLLRDDRTETSALDRRVRPVLQAAGLQSGLEQLAHVEPTEQEPFARYRAWIDLMEAYPEAPVDLHLRAAIELADAVSQVEALRAKSDRIEPWTVVELLSRESDAFVEVRGVIEEHLGDDPADVIREQIEIVRVRDPAYLAAGRRARGMPEASSVEYERMFGGVSSLSPFEVEAVSVAKLRALMAQASAAEAAADGLLMLGEPGAPTLPEIAAHLDRACDAGVIAPLPALANARDRVRGFITNHDQPDTLARLQTSSAARHGRDRLVAIAGRTFDGDYPWLRGIRDHDLLGARVRYEAGDYRAALESMLPEQIALALAYPTMTWTALPDDGPGTIDQITIREESDALVVSVRNRRGARDVLRLAGLDDDSRQLLEQRLAGAKVPPYFRGRMSEAILMQPVPPRDELVALRQLVTGAGRLAVLRAMVYGCAPPAASFVPPSGRCRDAQERGAYDRVTGDQVVAVRVPTLDAVFAGAGGDAW